MLTYYPGSCNGGIVISYGFDQSGYPTVAKSVETTKKTLVRDEEYAKRSEHLCMMLAFINNKQRDMYLDTFVELGWQEVGASTNPQHKHETTVYMWIKLFNQPDIPVITDEPTVKPTVKSIFKDVVSLSTKKSEKETPSYKLRSILLRKRSRQ